MSLRPEAARVNATHGPHGALHTIAAARAAEKAWSHSVADVGGNPPHPDMPKGLSAAGQKAWEERHAGKLEEEKRKRDAQAMQLARERERAAAKARMSGAVDGVVRQARANQAEKMYHQWKAGDLKGSSSTDPPAPPPAPPRAVPPAPPPAPPPEGKRPAAKASSSSEGMVVDSLLAEVAALKKELAEKNDDIVELARQVEHWKLRFEHLSQKAFDEMMARENSRAM